MARKKISTRYPSRETQPRSRYVVPDSGDDDFSVNNDRARTLRKDASRRRRSTAPDPSSESQYNSDNSSNDSTLSMLSRTPSVSSNFLSRITLKKRPPGDGIMRFKRPVRPYIAGTNKYKLQLALIRSDGWGHFIPLSDQIFQPPTPAPQSDHRYRGRILEFRVINRTPLTLTLPRSPLKDDHTESFFMRYLRSPDVVSAIPFLEEVKLNGVFFNVKHDEHTVISTQYQRAETTMYDDTLDTLASTEAVQERKLIIVVRDDYEIQKLIGQVEAAVMQGGHFRNKVYEPLGSDEEHLGDSDFSIDSSLRERLRARRDASSENVPDVKEAEDPDKIQPSEGSRARIRSVVEEWNDDVATEEQDIMDEDEAGTNARHADSEELETSSEEEDETDLSNDDYDADAESDESEQERIAKVSTFCPLPT